MVLGAENANPGFRSLSKNASDAAEKCAVGAGSCERLRKAGGEPASAAEIRTALAAISGPRL